MVLFPKQVHLQKVVGASHKLSVIMLSLQRQQRDAYRLPATAQ